MKKIYLFLLCISCIFSTEAQTFHFEEFETDLQDFGVFSTSLIDSSGTLWVGGSSAAIASYENEEWQVYDLDVIFDGQLSSFTRISDLFEDSKGSLWAISDKGIFQLADGEWTYYKDELEKTFGYTIAEKADTLYFSTRGGVMKLADGEWSYSEIAGNQPAYVAVDGDGFVWVSFSNGDGNYKYVDGEWQLVSTDNSEICTRFALDNETSPNGDMWIIGASGAMCKYDGENFRDYKLEGGVLGLLNTIAFSPEGNHVFIGGDEFGEDRSIKHFFQDELVSTYGTENGLANGEVFSIAVESESSVFVFFEDAIYKGSMTSDVSSTELYERGLVSTLVVDQLVFGSVGPASGFIFDVNGRIAKNFTTTNSVVDVSDLQPGIYFVKMTNQLNSRTEKFIKL